jgi:uncharacterized protein DUF1416
MATITGTVTLDQSPAPRVYVRLYGPSGEFVSEEYTREDGRFLFHVASGTWTLEARAAGAETEKRAVDIKDADASADIALRRSA